MDASHLHPEIRDHYKDLRNPPVRTRLGRWYLATTFARTPPARLPAGMQRTVGDFGNGSGVRVFVPSNPNGSALLWIHGGGLIIGNATLDDDFCIANAQATGATVISVEYRLAPQHPFPTPLEDCHAAWNWLLAHAGELAIDPHRIVVGGSSAGGGLSAALVQLIHDNPGPQPIGQWLLCPMLDDRTAARRELDAIDHHLWNNRSNVVGWTSYLGVPPGAPQAPAYAVPARRTDLSGLPPAFISSSNIELFFDEDASYARALREAGVACEFYEISGAPHGFERAPAHFETGQIYLAATREWLGRVLAEGAD